MFRRKQTFTREEECECVIQSIRDFLAGTGNAWDWDDFTSIRIGYPDLDAVRGFCLQVRADYPPTDRTHWCNPDGLRELRRKLDLLEAESLQARRPD